ncbi:UPF0755 protein [Rhodoglobus vestalii]|uniref:Endolytic murein transglycosylase n=1 Tax=Rhodoglobus vestalii TaxID=193384 RepID=A0A8H2K4I9_9MICO|nr:endolytic transglycosylase MltG [Rhodoglobus vestalii]TQO18574.1 UPF0755 protein [Rhodoglobus vestalii]
MADEPKWEDIFQEQADTPDPKLARPAGSDDAATVDYGAAANDPESSAADPEQPMTRREAREAEAARESRSARSGATNASASASPLPAPDAPAAPFAALAPTGDSSEPPRPPRRKRRLWLIIGLPILLLALAGGAVATYAWATYEEQIREVFGWELTNDFEGAGNGEEIIFTVNSGDIGSDIARSLHDIGVTMSFDAFYDLLLTQESGPAFYPGNYALQGEMSAQSALDALLDPASKVTDRLLITEGTILPNALEIIAETTGIPLAELQAASEDLDHFGLPAEAPSLEGYLFPATYDLDGGQDAYAVLDKMVNTMFERLDAAGVAEEDRFRVLTMASLVQREAGPNTEDFYKISRVFYNRLDDGMLLQSDATVAYGTGNLHTVWTDQAERDDASNPYNTYANLGLPVGPIGLPGEIAIDAALNPAAGEWVYFVTVNLATGETVFNTNVDAHEESAQQLYDWCEASEENASYC